MLGIVPVPAGHRVDCGTIHTWIRAQLSGIITTVLLNTALLFMRSEVNLFIHPTSICRAPTVCQVRREALGHPSTHED